MKNPHLIYTNADLPVRSTSLADEVLKSDLHNRRYIGSKAKLSEWIMDCVLKNIDTSCSIFFDAFAGTGAVTRAALPHFSQVYMNDLLYANQVAYHSFFNTGRYSKKKISELRSYYNKLNSRELNPNYFSDQFGGKYFSHENARKIGFIREDLQQRRPDLTKKEFSILLTSLIYAMDKIANTVGHYDAYIKKPISDKRLELMPLRNYGEQYKGVKIYRTDSNLLAPQIKADVTYLDPPYNSRQYNRFYHIYENLVRWQKPELFGVAMKPKAENSSIYCTVAAKAAFQDLVSKLNTKYIFVSYNNTYASKSGSSRNKIQLEDLKQILSERGETTVFEKPHRYFSTGKTEFADHKELLFATKIYE